MEYNAKGKVLKKAVVWQELYFYRKSDAIYQLTQVFCRRFLPLHGDRTVDQMVQAACSCKQNIVEGSEDGQASSEMEIKLINVARGSLQELRQDYLDYLKSHGLCVWDSKHPRFDRLLEYCRRHNDWLDYQNLSESLPDEDFCNMALTLCHITDKMISSYLKGLEQRFVTEGGIKERMHAARTGYREEVDRRLRLLEEENTRLKAENQELKRKLGII